jgi:prophage DNA circulation protein
MIQDMTDPIASALADVDTQVSAINDAVSGISTELGTVVTLVQQLQAEVAAGNSGNATAIAAQIEQRVTSLQGVASTLNSATTAAQSTLSGATPPAATDTGSTTPPADTSAPTSTDTAAPVADSPATGSAMG